MRVLCGRRPVVAGVALAGLLLAAPRAAAQMPADRERLAALAPVFTATFEVPAVRPAVEPAPAASHPARTRRRPAALVPLYVSFAGLQALDMHSTFRAVDGGAREMNPLVGSLLDSPASLLALKTGAAAGTILVVEKLWKRHPVAAVVTMVALNSAYAVIVSRNYSAR